VLTVVAAKLRRSGCSIGADGWMEGARIDGARARSDIVWVGCYTYLRGTLQAGGRAAATKEEQP